MKWTKIPLKPFRLKVSLGEAKGGEAVDGRTSDRLEKKGEGEEDNNDENGIRPSNACFFFI